MGMASSRVHLAPAVQSRLRSLLELAVAIGRREGLLGDHTGQETAAALECGDTPAGKATGRKEQKKGGKQCR